MPTIFTRYETERGCGWRKPGGFYLVGGYAISSCCKLPLPLGVCPCCGEGMRFSRAPRWLAEPERLWAGKECQKPGGVTGGGLCPLAEGRKLGPSLLIWVGERFYPTPDAFISEGLVRGISRRLYHLPKGFTIGETWVLLAHRRAIPAPPPKFGEAPGEPGAGLFGVFRPTAIEYVVRDDDPVERLEALANQGITLVRISRIERLEDTTLQLPEASEKA